MRVLRVVGKSAATTILFFLIVEIGLRAVYFARNSFVEYVPLPYVVGDDYGPIPPWLDNLLILKPDDALIWKNLPNARRAYVDIFTPVWSDGDRMALLRRFAPWLPAVKRPGVLRVACIGDSWTFGMNVNQDQSYPARLDSMIKMSTNSPQAAP